MASVSNPADATRTDTQQDGGDGQEPANTRDALDAPDFSIEDTLNALLENGQEPSQAVVEFGEATDGMLDRSDTLSSAC